MDQSKPWFSSVTIWGAILAIALPPLGKLLHITFTSDQASQLASLLAQAGDQLQILGPLVGGFMAWFGRVRATTQIGGSGSSLPPKS